MDVWAEIKHISKPYIVCWAGLKEKKTKTTSDPLQIWEILIPQPNLTGQSQ